MYYDFLMIEVSYEYNGKEYKSLDELSSDFIALNMIRIASSSLHDKIDESSIPDGVRFVIVYNEIEKAASIKVVGASDSYKQSVTKALKS